MLAFGIGLLALVAWAEHAHATARLGALNLPDDAAPQTRRTWFRGRSFSRRVMSDAAGTEIAIIADLLEELLVAGSSLTGALAALGRTAGWAELAEVARALERGTPWRRAWRRAAALQVLAEALETSWQSGAAPSAQLRVLARAQREQHKKARAAAAGRLGVWLLIPLGLCYLPAFVLVAVVPLLLGLAGAFFS